MFEKKIRRATDEEISFYENTLYPFQDEVFSLIQTNRFYLSGGTCLSRFYYHHRFSEDLDFFFDGYLYSKEEFEIVYREIINRISEKFTTEITIEAEYFKRGFIYKEDIPLKIEFIYENYKNVGNRNEIHGIWIDSKENIATNKLTAAYDRKNIKDFIDLYYLLGEIEFEQTAKWAQHKAVPMDYEGVIITFADPDLEGTVILQQEFPVKDFNTFVKNLIMRMLNYAKSLK